MRLGATRPNLRETCHTRRTQLPLWVCLLVRRRRAFCEGRRRSQAFPCRPAVVAVLSLAQGEKPLGMFRAGSDGRCCRNAVRYPPSLSPSLARCFDAGSNQLRPSRPRARARVLGRWPSESTPKSSGSHRAQDVEFGVSSWTRHCPTVDGTHWSCSLMERPASTPVLLSESSAREPMSAFA
jgi:hypothetical protein